MGKKTKQIEVKSGIRVNLAELKLFVRNAKKATYASGGGLVPENRVQIPGNTEHEYQEVMPSGMVLYYRDSYCGYLSVSGKETVRIGGEDGLAVWAMSYDGGMAEPYLTSDELSLSVAGRTFGFLKSALSKVPIGLPFRGPQTYDSAQHQGFIYCCYTPPGTNFKLFSGVEMITASICIIFVLYFSGGIIVHQ